MTFPRDPIPATIACLHQPAILQGKNIIHPSNSAFSVAANFPLILDCGEQYDYFFLFSYSYSCHSNGFGIENPAYKGEPISFWTTVEGSIPAGNGLVGRDLVLEVTRLDFHSGIDSNGRPISDVHYGLIRGPLCDRHEEIVGNTLRTGKNNYSGCRVGEVVAAAPRSKDGFDYEIWLLGTVPSSHYLCAPYS